MARRLLLLLLFACATAQAAPIALGPQATFLEDKDGTLTLEDVRRRTDFAPVGREVPNFGYSSAAHWLRFQLPRDSAPEPLLVLEIRFPSIDTIELHVPYLEDGQVRYRLQRGGDQVPWDTREVKHRNAVFRVTTAGLADAPTFLRVRTQSVLTVPVYLWRPEDFAAAESDSQLGYGLFYGLVIALFLYNLMLLVSLRDPVYLWYVLYVGAFGVGLATLDGFAFQYLWPQSVWWANHALGTAMCATLLFGVQFGRRFLDVGRSAPFADRFFAGVVALCAVGALLSATGWLVDYATIMRTLSVVSITTAGMVLVVAARSFLRGYRPARFFLLAWSALLVFVALAALRNFKLVPSHFLTLNGMHLGLALDVLLLSFALGDRIQTLRRATEVALAEARERERMVEQLRYMAQHDPLTGLPNRASMQQRLALAIEMARRNRRKLAVMLVDLDGFKAINDGRGHLVGDQALAEVARRLRSSVRGSDTVARYGGDEFVVLAGELERDEDAARIAEKIADMVSVPLSLDGRIENLGCSIGISVYPEHGTEAGVLVERADRAMYVAKAAKASRAPRYVFFSAA